MASVYVTVAKGLSRTSYTALKAATHAILASCLKMLLQYCQKQTTVKQMKLAMGYCMPCMPFMLGCQHEGANNKQTKNK
jgi:hypothetical protein